MTEDQIKQAKEQFLVALYFAKQEIPEIEKNKTAKVRMKSGGEFSYKYADLADVQRAIKEPLFKFNLILRHEIKCNDKGDGELLTTHLVHIHTKEEFTSAIEIRGGQLQEKGADITYAKRYNIGALLDLLLDEDVDAPQRDKEPPKSAPPQQKTSPPAEKKTTPPPNPGDYRIRIGKFAGKRINEVDIDELWAYVNELEAKAAEIKKPLSAVALEFIENLKKASPPHFDGEETLPDFESMK